MLYDIIAETRTVSVIGMCKNAGKTTALNSLISACNAHGELLGLTSIGRDGERSDIVTNTKKPEIYVQRGTYIATAEALLYEGDISREIVASTDISTPMGNIIIVRAMSAGYVQLGGPSITENLIGIRDTLLGLGCDRVFIDGAISRKSLGAPLLADGVLLCSGASYNPDARATAEDTAYIASLFTLPLYEGKSGDGRAMKVTAVCGGEEYGAASFDELPESGKKGIDALVVRGAFTDSTAAELLNNAKLLKNALIVAEDPSRMLLGGAAYQKLKRFTLGFEVLNTTKLLAVTVNPFSAYGNHYDIKSFTELTVNALKRVGLELPVINVMEL